MDVVKQAGLDARRKNTRRRRKKLQNVGRWNAGACAKLSLNSWQYVDRCYSIVAYCDTWASEFLPIPHEAYWPQSLFGELLPNLELLRNKKGRPRSTRLRNRMDIKEQRSANLCGICKQSGHNRKKCPSKPKSDIKLIQNSDNMVRCKNLISELNLIIAGKGLKTPNPRVQTQNHGFKPKSNSMWVHPQNRVTEKPSSEPEKPNPSRNRTQWVLKPRNRLGRGSSKNAIAGDFLPEKRQDRRCRKSQRCLPSSVLSTLQRSRLSSFFVFSRLYLVVSFSESQSPSYDKLKELLLQGTQSIRAEQNRTQKPKNRTKPTKPKPKGNRWVGIKPFSFLAHARDDRKHTHTSRCRSPFSRFQIEAAVFTLHDRRISPSRRRIFTIVGALMENSWRAATVGEPSLVDHRSSRPSTQEEPPQPQIKSHGLNLRTHETVKPPHETVKPNPLQTHWVGFRKLEIERAEVDYHFGTNQKGKMDYHFGTEGV
ncbi:hypothetical protein LXL04_015590 [Taraxacum kok-saghyz]